MTLWGLAGENLATFALTSVLIELTPGPNMAYLAILAVGEGRRAGFAAVAGVALGLSGIGVAAALGLAALIAASPMLYQVLRWAGVAYLLWLAWDGWRDAAMADTRSGPVLTAGTYFRRGLVTNLLNPKAAVFFIAVLPGFVVADAPVLPQTLVLSAIYVAAATVIHGGIVALASSLRPLLTDPVRLRRVRRALSLALAGVALWFAWKTRF